jgi:coenzyme PQQ precursor peptide PqqA
MFPRDVTRLAPIGRRLTHEEQNMRWSKPRIIELPVGMEINSYACAKVA